MQDCDPEKVYLLAPTYKLLRCQSTWEWSPLAGRSMDVSSRHLEFLGVHSVLGHEAPLQSPRALWDTAEQSRHQMPSLDTVHIFVWFYKSVT